MQYGRILVENIYESENKFHHNCKACLMTLTLHSDALCWDLVGTVVFTKYMITKETIHLQHGIFYFFNVYLKKTNKTRA